VTHFCRGVGKPSRAEGRFQSKAFERGRSPSIKTLPERKIGLYQSPSGEEGPLRPKPFEREMPITPEIGDKEKDKCDHFQGV
jgi:hypothetical protein